MQILEVVRLEGQALTHDDGLLSRDIHLLQVIMICFGGFPGSVLLLQISANKGEKHFLTKSNHLSNMER